MPTVPRAYAPVDRIGVGTQTTREYQLLSPDDENPDQWDVVDLTDASQVTLSLLHVNGGFHAAFEEACPITVGDEGKVEYHWDEQTTWSTAGDYYVQFEVTYNNGDTELVPPDGYDAWMRLAPRQAANAIPISGTSLEFEEGWIGDLEVDTLTVVDALEGLTTGSLNTIDGPGLTNDGGALTVTAELGIEGMSNPATADLNMDGFAIHSAGSIGATSLDVGTLASPVDASGNGVTGLPAPSVETDAARLAETSANADDIAALDSAKASREGDTLDPAVLNNKRIVAPSIPGAFDTIMGAYNDLPATGGTIEYVETVQETGIVFDKPIRLLGQGSERSTTIGAYIDCTGGDGIHINTKAVVLRDVHVEGTSVSTYGIRVGESGNFIENINLDNVSVRNCDVGFHFTGWTQTVRPNILAGGNDIGVLVDGVDGDWVNSIQNGTILAQSNETYGFRVEGAVDFNGNSFWFAGENPNATWDMSVVTTGAASACRIIGYGWHDAGLQWTSGGSANYVQGRILRGSKDVTNLTGELRVGYSEAGDDPTDFNSDTGKVGAVLDPSSEITTTSGTWTSLPMDDVRYDHWSEYGTQTGTQEWTIPVDGVWQIKAKAQFYDNGVYENLEMRIDRNGTLLDHENIPQAPNNPSISASRTLECTAGDVISVQVRQNTGNTLTVRALSSNTRVEIMKLG